MQVRRTRFGSRPRMLLAGAAAALALALAPSPGTAHAASPLDGNGMWIWYVSRSGGSAETIARKANKHNIDLVLIKSSDATSYWEQFSPGLVRELGGAGLDVCAWQFVYGNEPRKEALRGADAVDAGADCLVIDAESHYEGRYRAADRYVDKLRDRIGKHYPLALASFPYVDYHPSFPYSVFLGKGAAQFNVPQMYWKTIGTSVRRVYEHTYRVNAPFDRPIFPLGQTYLDVSRKSVIRFRRHARRRGADGVSWWSWQETKGKEWRWVGKELNGGAGSARVRASVPTATPAYAALGPGESGDLVVWAQQLLRAHGQPVEISGTYDSATAAAVAAFRAERDLAPDGALDDPTWRALLTRRPAAVEWSRRPAPAAPASASLESLRLEIPPTPERP